jgi:hypothetical protein
MSSKVMMQELELRWVEVGGEIKCGIDRRVNG